VRGSSSAAEHSRAQAHRTTDAATAPSLEEQHLEMFPEGTSDVPRALQPPWPQAEPKCPEQSLAKAITFKKGTATL